MRAALARDPAATDALLERLVCVPRMLAARNRKLGRPLGPAELEDLAQDTLLALWRKLERYNGSAALESWVYSFCFLELMKRLRRERNAPHPLAESLEGSPLEPHAPAQVAAVEQEHVLAALEGLEPDEAEILRLKHFDDLTFEEIGAALGLSPNTAKTRYYRGLRKLRQRLGGTGGEEGERKLG